MIKYILRLSARRPAVVCLLTGIMALMACSKESALEPSDKDINYFVVNDNPNDPVQHAMYQFYEKTGIATFHNDTI